MTVLKRNLRQEKTCITNDSAPVCRVARQAIGLPQRIGALQIPQHPSERLTMRQPVVRDGVVAGVLGATAVVAWFLGVDLI
jgi:hypothetical protein